MKRLRVALLAVFSVAFFVSMAQGYVRAGIKWATDRIWPTDRIMACIDENLRGIGPSNDYPITIAFTRLGNDPQDRQTRTIDDSLRELFESGPSGGTLRLISIPCALIKSGGDVARNQQAAASRAQSVAHRIGADIVVWGEVRARGDTLDLHFTHAEGVAADQYTVEEYALGLAFDQALGTIVAAKAVGLAHSAAEDRGRFFVPLMESVLAVTTPLANDPPRGLPPLQHGHLFEAHARVQDKLGTQAGRNSYLIDAIQFYKRALEVYGDAGDEWHAARTRNNLANALAVHGERMGDAVVLGRAIDIYREALVVRTQFRDPLAWAATQNNLGNALQIMGEWQGDSDVLREAVTALELALAERTQTRMPVDWAATKNNLGYALQTLGELTEDPELLRGAIRIYQQALVVRNRGQLPIAWAATQNNLGNAQQLLGRLTKDEQALRSAIAAYENALTERRREIMPFAWASTKNNLGRALTTLGELTADRRTIDGAISAYEQALTIRQRDGQLIAWAATQKNWAKAEVVVFHLDGDSARLESAQARAEEARSAFREANLGWYAQRAEALLTEIANARGH